MNDYRFRRAAEKASAQGSNYFTSDQFVATAIANYFLTSKIGWLVLVLVVLGVTMFLPTWLQVLLTISTGVFALVSIHREPGQKLESCKAIVQQILSHWMTVKDRLYIEKLLLSPGLPDQAVSHKEKDIFDYGVKSILVVEHDLLVDLLVYNGFAARERTLVVAASRYPGYLYDKAVALAGEYPALDVLALHDASPEGRNVVRQCVKHFGRVRDLGWSTTDVNSAKFRKAVKNPVARHARTLLMCPFGLLASGLSIAMSRETRLIDAFPVALVNDGGDSSSGYG